MAAPITIIRMTTTAAIVPLFPFLAPALPSAFEDGDVVVSTRESGVVELSPTAAIVDVLSTPLGLSVDVAGSGSGADVVAVTADGVGGNAAVAVVAAIVVVVVVVVAVAVATVLDGVIDVLVLVLVVSPGLVV